MNSRDFCFWLQGFFEIHGASGAIVVTPEQTEIIRKHLDMVFVHDIDSSMGDDKQQELLNEIHFAGKGKLPEKKSEPWNDQYGKGVRPRC